jgi:translation initiation factor IF-1
MKDQIARLGVARVLQFEGIVTEILPDALYRVPLDAGHMVVVYTAGRRADQIAVSVARSSP